MTDDLTPERAREMLARDWGHIRVMDTVDAVVAQWERDRAERDALRERLAATESELERERMRNAACSSAALGYHTKSDEMHPDYDSAALQDVMRLRERLAEVTAQLHEFAYQIHEVTPGETRIQSALRLFKALVAQEEARQAAMPALAAIRAEREAPTTGED